MTRKKRRAKHNGKRASDPTSSAYYSGATKLDPPYACVIYDSRAHYDEDGAAALDAFEVATIPRVEDIGTAWRGQMAVLFCYDRIQYKGRELLVNGRMIGTIP